MKSIRWSGLAAFIVILALLIGGALLFAETVSKSLLESSLSKLNGARVDIGKVNIGYSPLLLELIDVQVTDKQNPMVNAIQIGKAIFQLSFRDLLLKKVIIDEMSLNNIQVETTRSKSGALVEQKKLKSEEKSESMFSFEMPDIDLPDVGEILQIEPLTTDGLIKTLNDDFDATKQSWQASYDEITNQARWDDYEARYIKVKQDFKGDLVQKLDAIKQARSLKDDLDQEIVKIKQAKQKFANDSDRLENEYKAAKEAPQKDIKSIKDKLKLDSFDTSNLTRLIFGEQAAYYIDVALTWYQRIKPYLGEDKPEPVPVRRSEGENIKFREYNPRPGFFVGKAALDVVTARGQFEGNITDISSDQSINKKSTRFLISGQELRYRKSEQIAGEINYIVKSNGFVEVNYDLQDYQIDNFILSRSRKLEIAMVRGLMDMKVQVRLQSGRLMADANADFNQVAFSSNKDRSGSSMASMLAASLIDIHRFNINALFSGSLKDLDMKIRSDLDNQLGAQLKNRFKLRVDAFEKELKDKIEEKYQEPLQRIEAKREQLRDLKKRVLEKENEIQQKLADLENRIAQEKSLKEQEIKSVLDNKKDQLLDKIKSKYFK